MLISSGAILFVSWRGFKGRANAEGLRAGQGECRGRFKGKANAEGPRARRKVVQGQGKRWFKGKAKGGSRVNAGAIEKR